MASESERDYGQEESLLGKEEDGYYTPAEVQKPHTKLLWVGFVFAIVASLLAGFFVGQMQHKPIEKYGYPLPPGSVEQVWELNSTFIQRPTPESEAAWNSLVPVGRGFIHHDELAPFISNIAVFHQLHCLHGILGAYYKALESPATTKFVDIPEFDPETGVKTAQPHIHHCFDYLRQSLMCAADTNLEVLDHETHGTNGWGQPKTCRSYEQVFAWAERYANSTDTGILSR